MNSTTRQCPPPFPPKRTVNELPQRKHLFWPAIAVTAASSFAVGLLAHEYLPLSEGVESFRIEAEALSGGIAIIQGRAAVGAKNIYLMVESTRTGDRFLEPVTGRPAPSLPWEATTRLGEAASHGQTFRIQALATSHELKEGPFICSIPQDACLSNTVTLQHLP